jgi:hypothetical protein
MLLVSYTYFVLEAREIQIWYLFWVSNISYNWTLVLSNRTKNRVILQIYFIWKIIPNGSNRHGPLCNRQNFKRKHGWSHVSPPTLTQFVI